MYNDTMQGITCSKGHFIEFKIGLERREKKRMMRNEECKRRELVKFR